MEPIVGQTVSHYAFLEKLGAGGMGEIYKARDSRLNRIVAVKVLAPGRTRDSERRRRFIQEAQAASALNHPNIITIHDILSESDTQYMVMEHVAGQTLHALIAGGRLPVSQALQISNQMANALAAAHAAGIIHRDLKPANVMVTGSGLVKILDFGLAKLTDPTGGRPAGSDGQTDDPVTVTAAPLTVEGSIMGTVNYMSPEQAEGLKVDRRSDIFSFGAVLYEMVTGQRAFDGDSGISTLSSVLRDEVKPIREIAPEVPTELDDLIAQCLRKNPDDRWQSMAEVATALSSLRARVDSGVVLPTAGETIAPVTPTIAPAAAPAAAPSVSPSVTTPTASIPAPRSRPGISAKKTSANRWVLLGATGVAVVALAIAGAWWQTHRQSATAPNASGPVAAPVTTPAPPAPPPAPAAQPTDVAPGADQTQPETKNDAADAIVPTAAPPPSKPIVPLVSKSKTLPPPTVVAPKGPVQPNVATSAPAAPAAVAVVPAPRAPAAPEAVPVKLNDGLPFRIALLEDVPIDTEVGHALRFRVLDGLQSGAVVAIAKGAIVTGSVAALAGKRNFFGERSKVSFQLMSAESVDDGKINVRATPAAKTDGAETRPFVTPKGSPKDKNLIAAAGTEYVAYINGEQTVHVHK